MSAYPLKVWWGTVRVVLASLVVAAILCATARVSGSRIPEIVLLYLAVLTLFLGLFGDWAMRRRD